MGKPVKRYWTPQSRLDYIGRIVEAKMARDAARALTTKRLVGFNYLRGDLHCHTVYSDGAGSVKEMHDAAEARGLDFLFVTDHRTVRQKIECKKYRNVWAGQEPGTQHHHIVILDDTRKYTPVMDLQRDDKRLREMGAFFYYPHPTGWYPGTYYSDEKKNAFASLNGDFAIEVMSGIHRVEAFHDEWTDANVALWDHYLCEGFHVTGLAATDAHFPECVGNVWTGVLNARRSRNGVIRALRSGCVFASSGPAIGVKSGRTPMGGMRRVRSDGAEVDVECADSYGLSWIRVVRGGKVVRRIECKGAEHVRETVRVRLPSGESYVRVECATLDDRRAYANPVYFRRR